MGGRKTLGSPIETMMRNGIVRSAGKYGVQIRDRSPWNASATISVVNWDVFGQDRPIPIVRAEGRIEQWGADDADEWDQWYLDSDVHVLSYKCDLVLSGAAPIAIECDGHDWHDRTKQQAAYDRSRDRELLAIGVPTIRFTGSEIHHSLDRCVWHVFAVARSVSVPFRMCVDAFQYRKKKRVPQCRSGEEHW